MNVKVGTAVYNAAHTEAGPLLLGLGCALTHRHVGLLVCVIWLAHIGMDRMLGYGLKYETAFRDTHMQRV